jgi:YegS/Rv2252/BmrU family lipid kinase
MEEWFVIVNPNAGRRKAAKDWKQIASLLVKNEIPFKSVFTEHRNHAVKLAKKFIEAGFRKLIVVGGDGTFNETINGVFEQKRFQPTEVVVGIIPIGTGNDWARMFQIPHHYKDAVKIIKEGITFIQDVGRVQYHIKDTLHERYFANMTGMGFDAMVAEKTNKQKEKGKGGPMSYFYNIFTSLFSFNNAQYDIMIDDKRIRGSVFSMNVGICKYNGGGMKQLPFADPADGMLDMTIINKIGKLKVIRSVKKLYDGSFVEIPQVKTYQGTRISIKASSRLHLEADGESLGHAPFTFDIYPKSLKVIIGGLPE